MQPYCRNNSNFTFREICCGKPIYDDCECNKNNNCNHHKPDYDCGKKHEPPCHKKPKPKEPYICIPIKQIPYDGCNVFTYVMIGYMIGKNCNNNYFDYYNSIDGDNFIN